MGNHFDLDYLKEKFVPQLKFLNIFNSQKLNSAPKTKRNLPQLNRPEENLKKVKKEEIIEEKKTEKIKKVNKEEKIKKQKIDIEKKEENSNLLEKQQKVENKKQKTGITKIEIKQINKKKKKIIQLSSGLEKISKWD